MCTTNRQRRKKLILAYPDTRRLYRMMQVLAVFLVIATICIFAVGKWSENQIKEKNDRLFGRWDEVFLNVDEEGVEYFRQHAFVDDYSIQNIQEKIYLEGDDRIIIGTCDDNFFELGNLEMVDGRMPVNKGEVAIEEEYLELLGVEKVGDIISEGVNIDSLKGYKVCGIVKDYSSRWKMVNWDVKYINCFISDANANEIQIYASLSSAVQQDIETNMLEYKENLRIENMMIVRNIIELWIIIGLLAIILWFDLQRKIRHQISAKGIYEYTELNICKELWSKKRVKIFQTILKILLSILTVILVNKVVIEINYYDFHKERLQIKNGYNDLYNLNDDYWSVSSQFDNYPNHIIRIIYNEDINMIMDFIKTAFFIFLIEYLLIVLSQRIIEDTSDKYIHNRVLHNYYFGYKWTTMIKICKTLFKEILIYNSILTLFILSTANTISTSFETVFYNIVLSCLLNSIMLFIQSVFIYRTLFHLETSDDWLLVTEFE